jgi:hypothetical protein
MNYSPFSIRALRSYTHFILSFVFAVGLTVGNYSMSLKIKCGTTIRRNSETYFNKSGKIVNTTE